MKRPARKAIPVAVKRIVVRRQHALCKCGCGQIVSWLSRMNTHFDHEPALRLRGVNKRGTDYDPPQLHPDYIDARCSDSHRVKTHGAGATTAGSDIGKIKKMRKSEPGIRTASKWIPRKMRSRGFDKRHRPMRAR